MSPIDDAHTNLDLMARLGHPVILVTGSYLGALSHTLTALAALRARDVVIRGIVVSESERDVGLTDTVESPSSICRRRHSALCSAETDWKRRREMACRPIPGGHLRLISTTEIVQHDRIRTQIIMTNDWYEQGLPHVWLPYCQMQVAPPPLPVVRTHGCRIVLADGRELIDGIASWWSVCHGYNHPHILECVARQLETMPHVMFGGLVHEPALRLADPAVVPGASGADAGLLLRFRDRSPSRSRSRSRCNTGGISGGPGKTGSSALPTAITATLSARWRSPTRKNRCTRHSAAPWSRNTSWISPPTSAVARRAGLDALRASRAELAAMIIEPLVQGAGGMRFHGAEILAALHALARKHDILFIADEIATGFWRTGSAFACEEAGISPDILCLGKALTGGTIGMGATLASEEIFASFLSDDWETALMHGPTFMANPLACAAANASLDLFEREPRAEQVKAIEAGLALGAGTVPLAARTWWTCESKGRLAWCSLTTRSTSMHCGPDSWNRASGFGRSRTSSTSCRRW